MDIGDSATHLYTAPCTIKDGARDADSPSLNEVVTRLDFLTDPFALLLVPIYVLSVCIIIDDSSQ